MGAEATKADPSFVQFSDFMLYVRRAQMMELDQAADIGKELAGMKKGILHFWDKMSREQIRTNEPESVKITDIKHLLSSVGEKMSEEEIEEMSKEMRKSCRIQDGRVIFEDFVKMLN